MKLPYTRAMVNAAIEGALNKVEFETGSGVWSHDTEVSAGRSARSFCGRAMHGKTKPHMTRQRPIWQRMLRQEL